MSTLRKPKTASARLSVHTNPQVQVLHPFLKWPGGKRQLLPVLRPLLPEYTGRYYEAFVGAGALFFDQQPKNAVINDLNQELINCYRTIQKSSPALIKALQNHRNEEDYFYQVREWDRASNFMRRSAVERAARVIFMNKTCFNGLYRVNKQGYFNAPYGFYRKPNIVNAEGLKAISQYLKGNSIEIRNTDFESAVADAQAGDFVYFDPPYDPLTRTASFTGYQGNSFGKREHIRLRNLVESLTRRGCYVMLSNSATEFVEKLYSNFHTLRVPAKRAINSVGSKRGKVDELLVMNYDPVTKRLLNPAPAEIIELYEQERLFLEL